MNPELVGKKKARREMVAIIAELQSELSKLKYLRVGKSDKESIEKIDKKIAFIVWRKAQAEAHMAVINCSKGIPPPLPKELTERIKHDEL